MHIKIEALAGRVFKIATGGGIKTDEGKSVTEGGTSLAQVKVGWMLCNCVL